MNANERKLLKQKMFLFAFIRVHSRKNKSFYGFVFLNKYNLDKHDKENKNYV